MILERGESKRKENEIRYFSQTTRVTTTAQSGVGVSRVHTEQNETGRDLGGFGDLQELYGSKVCSTIHQRDRGRSEKQFALREKVKKNERLMKKTREQEGEM